MKNISGIVAALKLVIKYAAYITVIISGLNVIIEGFEALDKQENKTK